MSITIGKEWAMNDGKTVFAQLFVQSRMFIFRKMFLPSRDDCGIIIT